MCLNILQKMEVFRVGLKFKCPGCYLKFWSGIDEVKSKMVCEFCGNKFEITSQLKDRNWLYRRSGIFGQDDNQAGAIPVSLTLHQLRHHFSLRKFIYITGMNVEPKRADINKCETDFIVLTWGHDGKPSLIVSECKTTHSIERVMSLI